MIRKDFFTFNKILEDERKGTFKFWPFRDGVKCSKAKMAEAGFYSLGKKSEPDLAICYICCKELDGWEDDDDPWNEHKKHAPYCPFIKLGKKPSMLTLNDVIDLQHQHEILMATRLYEEKKKHLQEQAELVQDLVERTELKENEKPRGPIRKKRSSRK